MRSGPDDISSLSGKELIEKKVKEFTIMGGQYPEGKRYNIKSDPKAAAYVFENLDVPIVFTGWEVGRYIKTGLGIKHLDTLHPLYIGYDHYYKNAPWEVNATWLDDDEKGKMRSKPSFDQTAVLYAVRGGVGKYWELVEGGYCMVDTTTGDNRWVESEKANQAYLRLLVPPEEVAEVIENIMLGKFKNLKK
jgi:inosine-uridine nucleoside N-ribohydrolase